MNKKLAMTETKPQWQQGLYPVDIITATCNCGHQIDHEAVGVERIYGIWMNLAQFLGVTPIPKEVVFYCRQCGQEFASSTDRDIRDYYSF
jgi:hypothetical protein